ncbi:MAG: MarR family transcriptional regulator [Micrococcales bacterium 73-13]|nr:MAG: MarR family transcriptional regulator [Micrococcales bacterium 73-13]
MPPAKRAVVEAWEALFRAQVSVLRDLGASFPEDRLSLVEYDVLFNLSKLPDRSARPRDLTPLLLLSQPSVSRMIDRLARRGLVAKHPDPEDGRGTVVRLSDEGFDLFRRVAVLHAEAIARRFGDRLDEAELRTLTELCDRLRTGA